MTETDRIRARVLELMTKRGINARQLAAASGVSQPVLSRLLSNSGKRVAQRPSHTTISRLERYFGEAVSGEAQRRQPPGLEDFLSANRARRKIDDDEEKAMRRVGAPPGRIVGEEYWSALLLAIRTTETDKGSE